MYELFSLSVTMSSYFSYILSKGVQKRSISYAIQQPACCSPGKAIHRQISVPGKVALVQQMRGRLAEIGLLLRPKARKVHFSGESPGSSELSATVLQTTKSLEIWNTERGVR